VEVVGIAPSPEGDRTTLRAKSTRQNESMPIGNVLLYLAAMQ